MNITSEKELREAFARYDALVAADFEGNPEMERQALQLALAIQAYEAMHYPFPKPAKDRKKQ